jgi:hypothetical protein
MITLVTGRLSYLLSRVFDMMPSPGKTPEHWQSGLRPHSSRSKNCQDWPMLGPPLSTPENEVPYSHNVYHDRNNRIGLPSHSVAWHREQNLTT